MTFIDANVFLNSLLDSGDLGKQARTFLKGLDEKRQGTTSVLVLDEVFWILRKNKGVAEAHLASRRTLQHPGLNIIGVTPNHWQRALELMEARPSLKPRDAMHAAAALERTPAEIVSEDPDFDGIPGLRRVTVSGRR